MSRLLSGLLLCAPALAFAQTSVVLPGPSGRAQVSFEIRVPPSVRSEPLTGRVYAIISRDSAREPRLQVGRVGAPMFGHDVQRLAPGAPAVINGMDLGTPVFDLVRETVHRGTPERPLEIPAGAVVVPGARAVRNGFGAAEGLSLQTPVIVKYRDERTDVATALEAWLR